MRKLVLAVVVALLAAPLLAGCGGAETPKATRLPDATLGPLLESGTPAELRDLRGPMVVNLWANWCKPCRREMPIYQQFHEKHADVKVLGVDWQDPARDKALDVVAETKVTYPLVVDHQPVLRARGLPKLILLDAKGHVAYQASVEIKTLAQLEGLVRKHLGVDL